jgi:transcriptional regulator with GAF, ATPase, and Fis domain
MARKKIDLTVSQVCAALEAHATQREAARALNIPATTLSGFMKRHGFKKVERWERQAVQS